MKTLIAARAICGSSFHPCYLAKTERGLSWAWPISDGAGYALSIGRQEMVHDLGNYEFPQFIPHSKRFATVIWAGKNNALAVYGKTGTMMLPLLKQK